MRLSTFLETLVADLKFGARSLRRNPMFAAVAIITLALGIGANAAIFSVVNTVLLRPLPWTDPDRAVMIWSKWTAFDKTWVAEGEIVDYRKRSRTLSNVAGWSEGQINITGDGEPERVPYAAVSANLFSVFGVSPQQGRAFTPAEDIPNGPDLVVIAHGLWTRRYGADPSIIGRSIQLNGRPYQVVGIMPRDFVLPTDFQNPAPTQLWTPLQLDPASTDHGSHGYYAAGRLQPGTTVQQAAEELHGIAEAMTKEGLYPVQMRFDTVVVSLADEVVGRVRRAVLLLLGAVGFLLLIACANVANLLLARADARQREIAVRSALGAGGWRLVRQLLTESVVLTGVAAAIGLLLAFAAVRYVAWWNPANIPRVGAVGLDGRVLAFTAIVALLTSIVFSLAPALRARRVDLTDSLKDGQTTSGGGARHRFRNALVVVEMALAVVLLVGAGLMVRSLWSLQQIRLGFDPVNVLTMRVSLPQASYQRPEQVIAFFEGLLASVRSLPGVKVAGAVRSLPLGSTIGDWGLQIEGFVPPPGTNAKGDWQIATPGYLEAIGERIIRGRGIAPEDRTDSQPVALINEDMARKYWPGQDPLGRRIRLGGDSPDRPWVTVVGIVGDVRHNELTGVVKEKFYIPHTQWHRSSGNPIRSMTLVLKTSADPASLTSPVRAGLRRLDPNLPVADIRTMEDVVGATLSTPRFTGMLLLVFALLALVLSAIGIYGVLSYVVSRRTREIGIRVAIGAGRLQVLQMVLGQGIALTLTGVVIGIGIAIWASTLMRDMLHGVKPGDPLTFAAVGAVLTIVAILASLVPALRATRVDPVIALKTE
ncbi:MAG TPA: ABC transporter permease [Vicinamibacterales bacterium]|nr:ABC transporter permease [Vicinamibacterales bacterium]